jgi:hypothetical protein
MKDLKQSRSRLLNARAENSTSNFLFFFLFAQTRIQRLVLNRSSIGSSFLQVFSQVSFRSVVFRSPVFYLPIFSLPILSSTVFSSFVFSSLILFSTVFCSLAFSLPSLAQKSEPSAAGKSPKEKKKTQKNDGSCQKWHKWVGA